MRSPRVIDTMYRKIDGKTFHWLKDGKNKKDAQSIALEWRLKGYKARVIYNKYFDRYEVFVRSR